MKHIIWCMFVLLQTTVVYGQVCPPAPTTVSLNPTHVYADLYDFAQLDSFDVAYFDGVTLVQGPSMVPKTAWTQVAGTCYKTELPLQVPATGSFTAKVRWHKGTAVSAWSAPSHVFSKSAPTPQQPPPPSGLTIGPAELLYTNAQIPFQSIDGTFATLRKNATETSFVVKQWLTQLKFSGPLDKPLQTLEWTRAQDVVWNMRGVPGQVWLMNVYQVDAGGTLLGFVHKEVIGTPGTTYTYAVGLGYSTNNGDTWTYLGDIVTPPHNTWNVAGVPYLVVGPYFYVYFNDFPDPYTSPFPWGPATPQRKYMSVARALVSDVLQAAVNGTVTPWTKFNNGTWTQNGLGGIGSNIIPDWNTTYTDWQRTYDLHSDAAYNTVLQKYLLTVQTHNQGELLLYLSDDGVTWGSRTVIDTATSEYMQPYSTIVGEAGATADSREVGAEFYVMFPRKHHWAVGQDKFGGDYNDDTLYRRKITVGVPPPPPPPNGLSVYVSDLQWVSSTNGWGPAERDKDNGDLAAGDGGPLTLKGIAYAKGIGTHANSSIKVSLGGAFTTFVSDIGVDDTAGGGSIVFKVLADGAVLHDSGIIFRASATRTITLTVAGVSELELRVEATSDGTTSDWGDWAGARVLSTAPPVSCTYVIAPATGQAFSATGGTRSIGVTTANGCEWTVSSDALWLTTTTPIGTGTDDAVYVVAPSTTTASRTGTLTVAGQAIVVTQEGVPAPTCETTGPTVTVTNIQPRTIVLGNIGVVTMQVRSPSNRKIARLLFGFDAPSTFTADVGTGNVGAVRQFEVQPTAVGRFKAFVEAEDVTGCVTRTPFAPWITVKAVVVP